MELDDDHNDRISIRGSEIIFKTALSKFPSPRRTGSSAIPVEDLYAELEKMRAHVAVLQDQLERERQEVR